MRNKSSTLRRRLRPARRQHDPSVRMADQAVLGGDAEPAAAAGHPTVLAAGAVERGAVMTRRRVPIPTYGSLPALPIGSPRPPRKPKPEKPS